MFRYKLRTLLIVLAVVPPVLAWCFINGEWAAGIGLSVIVSFFCLVAMDGQEDGIAWGRCTREAKLRPPKVPARQLLATNT